MDPRQAHPDDETLFDLIEGRLDAARAAELEAHLDSCSECGELVRAAIAGSPDDTTPVVQMPDVAAVTMHRAIEGEWDALAAKRSAQRGVDAATIAAAAVTPLSPVRPTPVRAGRIRPTRSRRRWLVPSLAAAVLAVLAGTGIWLGEQPSMDGDAGRSVTATNDESSQAQDSAGSAQETITNGAAGAPADVEGAKAPTMGGATSAERDAVAAAADAAKQAPPASYDGSVGQLCIATFGVDAALALPDGRIPLQVLRGPFGITLVCG